MGVLVDSSVWIDASRKSSKLGPKLSKLILGEETVFYTKIIQTEVAQGARTHTEFQTIWENFLGFDELVVWDEHWEQSAWNYFRCRKKGLTTSTVDCLIATLSVTYRVPLWTHDKLFLQLQPIIGFDLYS